MPVSPLFRFIRHFLGHISQLSSISPAWRAFSARTPLSAAARYAGRKEDISVSGPGRGAGAPDKFLYQVRGIVKVDLGLFFQYKILVGMPQFFEKAKDNEHQELVAGMGVVPDELYQILAADLDNGCILLAIDAGGSSRGKKDGGFPEDLSLPDGADDHLSAAPGLDGDLHLTFCYRVNAVSDIILVDDGLVLIEMEHL
jgi:hypothetical protein